jgi:predicted PurR-regulated permease PerM
MEGNPNDDFFDRALESTIRLALLLLLAYWSIQIISPFAAPVLWGIIIAIAVYPLYLKLNSLCGDRPKLAATVFVLIAIAVLILPVLALTESLVESGMRVAEDISAGSVAIPPPNESVKEWPLVGERLHQAWALAANNLEAALGQVQPQLEAIGRGLVGMAASAGAGVLMFLLSIIISGVFLATASAGSSLADQLFRRLAPEQGQNFGNLTVQTIRGVAAGVLGVAFIQALLAGIGLIVADIPLAGLWALLLLLLGVVQLPPTIVILPIIIYYFSEADTTSAVIFTAYMIPVAISDNFLKPLLMGRNVEAPMLVIFLGAIGGFVAAGLIGLFIGGVILVLAFELARAWLYSGQGDAAPSDDVVGEASAE